MKPVVLVSGASCEMGAACARHLSDSGCEVFSFARERIASNEGVASSEDVASSEGVVSDAWLEDLLHERDSCEKDPALDEERLAQFVVEKVWNRKGRIDAVVNCLDYGLAGPIEETTVQEAQALFEANVFDMVRICRTVLPLMREQHSGLMINVGLSPQAVPGAFRGVYGASRQAMEALSGTLTSEVQSFGVEVVLIRASSAAATDGMPVARQARRETSTYKELRAQHRSREAGDRPDESPRSTALLIEGLIREAEAEPPGIGSSGAEQRQGCSRLFTPISSSGASENGPGVPTGVLPLSRQSSPLASFAGTWSRQNRREVEEAILSYELSRLQRGEAGPGRWTCTGRSLPEGTIYVAYRNGDSAPFTAQSGRELARLILDKRATLDTSFHGRTTASSAATGADRSAQS